MYRKGANHPMFIDGDRNTKTNPFYACWSHILQKCNNPKSQQYKDYGGRGIECSWKSYEHFKADMYEGYLRHKKKYPNDTSIDRVDNDGNYCKENCQWATQKQQCNNTRKNVKVLYNGGRYTYSQLSYKANVSRSVFLDRVKDGWDVETALKKPRGWKKAKKEKIEYPFLDKRQKLILKLRNEGRTLEMVGNAIGVTRERVRQLEGKARFVILDRT